MAERLSELTRVALIGRPNVGKSTLFNRLVGQRQALVDDMPGVTRDLREGKAALGDLRFTIVDSAGLLDRPETELDQDMQRLSLQAVAHSDIVLFVIDARVGITPPDRHFAGQLKKMGIVTLLLANKAEGRAGDSGVLEAFELGLGEPIPVSAEHGDGMGLLYQALRDCAETLQPHHAKEALPAHSYKRQEDQAESDHGLHLPVTDKAPAMRVAVIGRPNTGKSTLINRLIHEPRLLVGPQAGVTRDAIGVEFSWQQHRIKIFDTAGMRRKSKVVEKLEKLSVADALRAVRFCEVAFITIDATMPFDKQDLQIIQLVAREGRNPVLVCNKWDLVEDGARTRVALEQFVRDHLDQIKGVPIICLSALTGRGVSRLMEGAFEAHKIWNTHISTAALNRWLADALIRHPPPMAGQRRIRMRYITQPKSRPPHFAIFCSYPDRVPAHYQRYLTNGLRDRFNLRGTPIRLSLRKTANPYDPATNNRPKSSGR